MAKQKPPIKPIAKKESGQSAAIEQPTINQAISSTLEQNLGRWIPAIFAILIFVSYFPVWQNTFVWDDKPYIILNDYVKNFDLKGLLTEYHVGNYHPLTMLSLAIEYALVKEQTWLYHLDNLILHTLNSWLVFKLIQKLNGNFWVSFFTGALFAIHPLHVESVAWAAERKDVLYTIFILLSIWYYIKFDETQDKKWYAVSILLFLASCLSKGMAVVLPALLIITDYCFLKKPINAKLFINKIPYFILTFFFAYMATHAQKDAGADATSVISQAYTLGERILMSCYAFCFYWVKTIIPFKLYAFYPYPGKPNGSLPAIYSGAFLGVLLLVGAILWFGRKRQTYLVGRSIFLDFSFYGFAISVSCRKCHCCRPLLLSFFNRTIVFAWFGFQSFLPKKQGGFTSFCHSYLRFMWAKF
ncbi:MAG: glycosyltransferase family 39 protein [Emticicia sp.]|nr:glycosyltransferase family 39 protein [Emticicia sp.]